MLTVQHQPVETGQAQHFGADGICQRTSNQSGSDAPRRFKLIWEISLFIAFTFLIPQPYSGIYCQHYIYFLT
jgi:hypothetical protein